MLIPVRLRINRAEHHHDIEPRLLLVHYLRDRLGLTGTHVGCETGICGACTVLVGGRSVKSCTMFTVQADGADITTIEGIASNGQLHPMQEGFWECHGLQCGFCTPGMIMAAIHLLAENPSPSRKQIAHGLQGNLCRCTGYSHIVDSVVYAASHARPAEAEPHKDTGHSAATGSSQEDGPPQNTGSPKKAGTSKKAGSTPRKARSPKSAEVTRG